MWTHVLRSEFLKQKKFCFRQADLMMDKEVYVSRFAENLKQKRSIVVPNNRHLQ